MAEEIEVLFGRKTLGLLTVNSFSSQLVSETNLTLVLTLSPNPNRYSNPCPDPNPNLNPNEF